MFHNRLLAALLLAALLITTLAVTACNSTDPPPIDTTAATEADTTAAPKPASLALVADGKTAFTIIRAEEAEDDDTIDLLKRIMTAFEKNTGVRIALGTDWKKKGEEPNAESYEILVGATNHPESAQALEGVKYRDFAVVMIGNKIVLNGHTAQTQLKAVNYFINTILSRAEKDQDFFFTEADNYISQESYMLNTITLGSTDITVYTIALDENASYSEQDFARRLQNFIATRSGILVPIAEGQTEGKLIKVESTGEPGPWGASLSGGTLTCSAGSIFGWDALYTALSDIIREAKDTLSFEDGWSRTGDALTSDEEAQRAVTIDGDIRIMFHNIWGGSVYNRDDMEAVLFNTYLPDVLGLQEVNKNFRSEKVSLFDMLNDQYAEVPVNATNAAKNNYTPLLYRTDRLELIDAGWHLYDDGAGDQSKSVTWAIFKLKETGEQFGVASTHFYWTGDDLGKSARLIDAKEIAEEIEAVYAKYQVPIIIGGDFNCNISSDPLRNLRLAGWQDAWSTATVYKSNTNGHHSYATLDPLTGLYANAPAPSNIYSASIDHIYTYGEGIEVRVFDTILHRFALDSSDHCPIYVDISFKK